MKEGVPSRVSHLRFLINSFIDQELSNKGINDLRTSYGGIIYQLQTNDSLTMKELASRIGRDKSTLTTLIKKLSNNGYVTIQPNELDKRSKIVKITKKRKSINKDFTDISNTLYEKLWVEVSDKESDIFEQVLEKLI